MKKDLVIFGVGKIAEVVWYYATQECSINVVAFCVDAEFKTSEHFKDLPVVSFQNVESEYPPSENDMFIAVGYHDLNRVRETKCREAIGKGYTLISIVSPLAKIPTDLKFGYNCFIMPPALIHPCVALGNNVFVWSGCMVGHHSNIGDHCWLTSGANISGNVKMGSNAFLAVNATVGHSVNIGKNCFIGANTLITKNLNDEQVVITESTKPFRLTSSQFLKMSNFSSL